MDRLTEFRDAIRTHGFFRATDGNAMATENGIGPQPVWLFDFRALTLQPKWLDCYAEIFWERYADKYPFQVAGFESAGIALVAAIVMKSVQRGTPVNGFYIRKSRKRYDRMRRIEGIVTNDPVIIVDDVLNSGNTLKKNLVELADAGVRVSDFFGLLAFRAPQAHDAFTRDGIHVSTLYDLTDFDLKLLPSHAPEIPRAAFDEIWRFRAPNPSFNIVVQKSAPVIDEKYVYYGSDNGTFRALNQKSGSVVWEFKVGPLPPTKGILSSPALHEGTVFFGAYDGNVYALNAENGAKKWVYGEADWIGSSPSIAPDLGLLFIGLEFGLFRERGGIAALDIETGQEKWIDRTASITHGSPHYIRERKVVVIGSNDGVVYAYDAMSGKRLWQYQTGGDIKTSFAYDAKRDLVIFGSIDGICYALSIRDGEPHFAVQTGGSIYSIPLIHDNAVFVSSLDKRLYRIELDTGARDIYFETSGRIFASPAYIENSIWIGSNDGRLYELDPKTLKQRNTHQFSERIVNKITYNEKSRRFFVPTVANEIYCLKRKEEPKPSSDRA